MKIMILGSVTEENKDDFKRLCKNIAEAILELNATLIICSLFNDSVDYYVFEEFIKKVQV